MGDGRLGGRKKQRIRDKRLPRRACHKPMPQIFDPLSAGMGFAEGLELQWTCLKD